MAAKSSAASKPAERELVLTRILDAPRALVFKALTEPRRVMRWMGPKGFTIPTCEIDLRPGGGYRWCMRSPAGVDHIVRGVFREIVKPERLVFTWAWKGEGGKTGHETVVTYTLAKQGAKTKLTLHHAVFESVESRNAHNQGWTGSLDKLAEFVAQA